MIQYVGAIDDPCVAAYVHVGNHARLRAAGLFVAEGRLVVRRLIESRRFDVESVLVTPAGFADMADVLRPLPSPVYVAEPALLRQLTGFDFHRGCLALARRTAPVPPECFVAARRLLALEGVGNPDNLGGLFRVAAAFDVEGVVLSPTCVDPFYRKAIRTSMGAVLRVPWAMAADWPHDLATLRSAGLQIVALTPDARAMPLREFTAARAPGAHVMLMVGAEGPGLTPSAVHAADVLVRIPIAAAVDSLNVVVAAGIALAAVSSSE